MFTNKEVIKYTDLLNSLNKEENHQLPNLYQIIIEGGGHDGIPHFKLLEEESAETYIIWIRGTNFSDPNDILINIRATPIFFYGELCHRGYFFAAYAIIIMLRRYLIHGRFNKIVCLGHSLGGAVASIITTIIRKGNQGPICYASRLRQKFPGDSFRCLVFGTPPIFSLNMSLETKNYVTNVIIADDIVPKLGGLFNSLSKLQLRIVSMTMYDQNAVNFLMHSNSPLFEYFHSIFNRKLNADKLPGNVVLLHIGSDSGGFAFNSILSLNGLQHHKFESYSSAVKQLVPDNDEAFGAAQLAPGASSFERLVSVGFDVARLAYKGTSKVAELALKGGARVAEMAFGGRETVDELAAKGRRMADNLALKREVDAVEFALKGVEVIVSVSDFF